MDQKCFIYLGELWKTPYCLLLQIYAFEKYNTVVYGKFGSSKKYSLDYVLSLASVGLFNVLLVYDYNCLSHKLYDVLVYVQKFKQYGVQVVSYSQPNCRLLNSPMTAYRKK